MSDLIETFRSSLIQHGKDNDRAYLMKVEGDDCPLVLNYVLKLAVINDYSKVFAKTPASERRVFLDKSFVEEARVPKLFNGKQDGFFLSKYLDPVRRRETEPDTVEKVLEAAKKKFSPEVPPQTLEPGHTWRVMQKADAAAMARLYRQVFASYPFPIHDPEYLVKTMDENLVYHGIWQDAELVAVSSAEIDFSGQNAEMTDFATRRDQRGKGLATYLLEKMEEDVKERGIRTAYTIARAYSFGMNVTFAKHGYRYAGTLTNNTQISGRLESMNVWYKTL